MCCAACCLCALCGQGVKHLKIKQRTGVCGTSARSTNPAGSLCSTSHQSTGTNTTLRTQSSLHTEAPLPCFLKTPCLSKEKEKYQTKWPEILQYPSVGSLLFVARITQFLARLAAYHVYLMTVSSEACQCTAGGFRMDLWPRKWRPCASKPTNRTSTCNSSTAVFCQKRNNYSSGEDAQKRFLQVHTQSYPTKALRTSGQIRFTKFQEAHFDRAKLLFAENARCLFYFGTGITKKVGTFKESDDSKQNRNTCPVQCALSPLTWPSSQDR